MEKRRGGRRRRSEMGEGEEKRRWEKKKGNISRVYFTFKKLIAYWLENAFQKCLERPWMRLTFL